MNKPLVTVITTTIGQNSIDFLIDSIKHQNIPVKHILVWNDNRAFEVSPINFEIKEDNYSCNCVVTDGYLSKSSLKSIGLMVANTDIVTFADDNVMWEPNHLSSMLNLMKSSSWAYCKRRVWASLPNKDYEYLGVDEFESMGEEAKTEYKIVDNNCLFFNRRLGTSASVIYRETKENNDDKIMYDFLKKHGGNFSKLGQATVNVVCEDRLVEFFRTNCTL